MSCPFSCPTFAVAHIFFSTFPPQAYFNLRPAAQVLVPKHFPFLEERRSYIKFPRLVALQSRTLIRQIQHTIEGALCDKGLFRACQSAGVYVPNHPFFFFSCLSHCLCQGWSGGDLAATAVNLYQQGPLIVEIDKHRADRFVFAFDGVVLLVKEVSPSSEGIFFWGAGEKFVLAEASLWEETGISPQLHLFFFVCA